MATINSNIMTLASESNKRCDFGVAAIYLGECFFLKEYSSDDIVFNDMSLIKNFNRDMTITLTSRHVKRKTIKFNRKNSYKSFFNRQCARKKNVWKKERGKDPFLNQEFIELCSLDLGRWSWKNLVAHLAKRYISSYFKQEYVVKLIEDVILTMVSLFQSESLSGVLRSIITFIKLRSDKALCLTLCDSEIMDMFKDTFRDFVGFISDIQIMAGEPPAYLKAMRSMLSQYELVKNSVLVKKIRKFVTYLLSMSLFSAVGQKLPTSMFGKINEDAEKLASAGSCTDFIYYMLDLITYLGERIWQAVSLGSWSSLFHSSTTYEKWMYECTDCVNKSKFLGNPDAHEIDEHKYGADLVRLVDQGNTILKANKSLWKQDKYLHTSIIRLYAQIIQIKDEFITLHAAQSERRAPFGILIDGRSSVAKSTFSKILFYHYGKVFNKPLDDHYRYVRSPNDDFWSGFRTNCWCIHIDDVAANQASICPEGDKSVMELLQIVNQVPYNPNQADLSDKGRTPVRAELVTASTNNYEMNICNYYETPLAAQRRLKFVVHIQSKSEYSRSGMLDQSKIPVLASGEYPDFWNIYLYVVCPEEGPRKQQRGKYVKVQQFTGDKAIYRFLHWYTIAIKDHNKDQTEVMRSIEAIKNENVCESCYIPVKFCCCKNPFPVEICEKDIHVDLMSGEDEYFESFHERDEDKPVILLTNFFNDPNTGSIVYHYETTGYKVVDIVAQLKYRNAKKLLYNFMVKPGADYHHMASSPIYIKKYEEIFVQYTKLFMENYYKHKKMVVYHLCDLPFSPVVTKCALIPHITLGVMNFELCKHYFTVKVFGVICNKIAGTEDMPLASFNCHKITSQLPISKTLWEIDEFVFMFNNTNMRFDDVKLLFKILVYLRVRCEYYSPYLYEHVIVPFSQYMFGERKANYKQKMYYMKDYLLFRADIIRYKFGTHPRLQQIVAFLKISSVVMIIVGLIRVLLNRVFPPSKFDIMEMTRDPLKQREAFETAAKVVIDQDKMMAMSYEKDMIASFERQSTAEGRGEDIKKIKDDLNNTGRIPLFKSQCASQNIWYKDKFDLTPADLPKSIIAHRKMTPGQFVELFKDNLRVGYFRKLDGKIAVNRVLGICGHIWVTNKHTMSLFPLELRIVGRNDGAGVSETAYYIIYEQDTWSPPKSDLIFFNFKGLPPVKDIRKYFPEKGNSLKGLSSNGKMIVREINNYSLKEYDVRSAKLSQERGLIALQNKEDMWIGNSSQRSIKGECGSPLILQTHYGPVIAGIHCAYNMVEEFTYFLGMSQEMINTFVKDIQNEIIVDDGDLSTSYHNIEICGLHERSLVRFAKEGGAKVYGSKPGAKANPVSNVKLTCMAKAWFRRGKILKHCAPPLKAHEPWHKAFKESANLSPDMPQFLVRNAAVNFIEHLDNIKGDLIGIENCHVYPLNTALNGEAGVKYVEGMNRSTSTGFPFNHSKKYHLLDDPSDRHQNGIEVTDDILLEINFILSQYKKGIRYKPIFTASLKDEAITFEKAKIEKVRVFMGAPFAWSVVVRMYNLWFIQLLQSNKFAFMSAPGTNPWSREWDDFYVFLTKFGDQSQICLDFTCYDKSMVSLMILESFQLIIEVARRLDFSEEDLRVMKCIAEDTAFAIVNFKGDLVEMYGGNPSGHPLTVIINCIANLLYMQVAYTILNPEKECKSFFQNVRAMVYGDDNIMNVNAKEIPWFNGVSIAKTLKEFGVICTPADKKSKMVEYIPMSECSFLKRSWVYNAETQSWLAPLEEKSIEKSLLITVASKSVTPEDQAISICMNAHVEYFMYGREVFDIKTHEMKSVLFECGLEKLYKKELFPSWDKLMERYFEASKFRNAVPMGGDFQKPKFTNFLKRRRPFRRLPNTKETRKSEEGEVVEVVYLPGQGYKIGNSLFYEFKFLPPLGYEYMDEFIYQGVEYSKRSEQPWRWSNTDLGFATYTTKEIAKQQAKFTGIPLTHNNGKKKNRYQVKHDLLNRLMEVKDSCFAEGYFQECLTMKHYMSIFNDLHCNCPKCRREWSYALEIMVAYLLTFGDKVDPSEVIKCMVDLKNDMFYEGYVEICSDIVPAGGMSALSAAGAAAAGIAANVAYNAGQQLVQNINRGSAQAGRDLANGLTNRIARYRTQSSGEEGESPNTRADEAASSVEHVTSEVSEIKSNNAGGSLQTDAPENVKEQTTTFHSANAGEKIFHSEPPDLTSDLEKHQVGTELGEFLKRPVLIHTFQYGTSSSPATGVEIAPWQLYCQNPIIQKKIDNYAYLRGQLKIKIIVNSSPFFYGTVCYTYRPYSTNKTLPQTEPAFVLRSQRKNVWVYPQDNAGGDMTLPFFYSRPVLPLDVVSLGNMGTLNITPLMGLRSSNGTAAKTVSIKTYAWLEDFKLYGATLMSGESLGVPPTLGVSQKIAASIHGAARNVVDGSSTAVIPRVAPNMAQVGNNRNLENLTISPNQATSVGPTSVGLHVHDEMDINYICRKEAYLLTRDVAISTAEGTNLILAVGSPQLFRTSNGTGGFTKFCSPMCYIADLFSYWRGDIIIRLKFIKTQYHKGRFRFTFDPVNPLASTDAIDPQSRITHIIDIGETDEVEIRLPFMNSRNWASCYLQSTVGTTFWTNGGAVTNNPQAFSGYMSLVLETPLTAPGGNASDAVSILMFARGAENLEFSAPRGIQASSWLNFPEGQGPTQAIVLEEEKLDPFINQENITINSLVVGGDNDRIVSSSPVHNVYVGEKLRSLKDLAMRMTSFRTETFTYTVPNSLLMTAPSDVFARFSQNGIPWCRGVYNNSLLPGASKKVSYTINALPQTFENVQTPYSVYIMAMYCGHRGSFQWVFKPSAYNSRGLVNISRSNAQRSTFNTYRDVSVSLNSNTPADEWFNTYRYDSYMGLSTNDANIEPFFKLSSPNYNRYKFYTVDTRYRDGRPDDDSDLRGLNGVLYGNIIRATDVLMADEETFPVSEGSIVRYTVDCYSAAGADWECFYFLNVPPVWVSSVEFPPQA